MCKLGFLVLVGGALSAVWTCGAAELPQAEICADVQVGTEHIADLDCINRTLRSFSARQQGLPATAPIDTRSPSTAVGTANQAAARQMMGNAFGNSPRAQRPHPTFVSPLIGAPVTPPAK